MNKTRHMAALQSRMFAENDCRVLLVDLFGTGDSEGDFSDARWEVWRHDMLEAMAWLKNEFAERLVFWGVRLGCLLALDLLEYIDKERPTKLVFWQPVLKGEIFMKQFLRLRMAAGLLENNDVPTTKETTSELHMGMSVEIAGYRLSPELYKSVINLDMRDYSQKNLQPVDWYDVTTDIGKPINHALEKILYNENWINKPVLHRLEGEHFWTTPEITILPKLIEMTSNIIHQE